MPPETGRVQLDAWSVFRRTTFLAFVILEVIAWQRLGGIRFRRPLHKILVLLIHPEFTRRSLLIALLVGSLVTILGVVLVRLVVGPLLDRWLRPITDSSIGSFHLGPGERVVATTSARKRAGRSWQPGSLVLTDRRLWFFPEAWSMEPWSAPLGEGLKMSVEPSRIPRWLPIRNWPDRLVAEIDPDRRDILLVAEPATVLAWFSAPRSINSLPSFTLH